jgi:hypothetical protein
MGFLHTAWANIVFWKLYCIRVRNMQNFKLRRPAQSDSFKCDLLMIVQAYFSHCVFGIKIYTFLCICIIDKESNQFFIDVSSFLKNNKVIKMKLHLINILILLHNA